MWSGLRLLVMYTFTTGTVHYGVKFHKRTGDDVNVLFDVNTYSEFNEKHLRLELLSLKSKHYAGQKNVRRIWQLRRTIGKYVVNVRRVRRISNTLWYTMCVNVRLFCTQSKALLQLILNLNKTSWFLEYTHVWHL